MARAQAIATLVLGSRGITITPVSILSKNFVPESSLRILRDTGRSLLWLTTGRTGASLNPCYSYTESNLDSPGLSRQTPFAPTQSACQESGLCDPDLVLDPLRQAQPRQAQLR